MQMVDKEEGRTILLSVSVAYRLGTQKLNILFTRKRCCVLSARKINIIQIISLSRKPWRSQRILHQPHHHLLEEGEGGER